MSSSITYRIKYAKINFHKPLNPEIMMTRSAIRLGFGCGSLHGTNNNVKTAGVGFLSNNRPYVMGKIKPDLSRAVMKSVNTPIVASSAQFTAEESDMIQVGAALRNIGWISFWSQLILSTVSGVVLLFSLGVTTGGSLTATPTDVCTLVGVGCGLLTSMLSWTWIRAGRKLQELKNIRLQQCMGTVLASTNLNLIGMGATILGLQANVGALVAKTLTSAAGGLYYNPRAAPPPVAFDVFTVQSCTNTIMAHFVGLVLAQWLLRVLRVFISKEEERM